MQQQPVTLEQAMDLADHASPAPWIASQALKAMREEIERLASGNPADYQHWVEHNWNRLGYERETNELRELFIMSVGIGGEAGEVQELLKKHVRDEREIVDDLILELGDVLHYLTRIASQFGITLEEVMVANREKIEQRHAKRMAEMRCSLCSGTGEVADSDGHGALCQACEASGLASCQVRDIDHG